MLSHSEPYVNASEESGVDECAFFSLHFIQYAVLFKFNFVASDWKAFVFIFHLTRCLLSNLFTIYIKQANDYFSQNAFSVPCRFVTTH